jgi:osmotically-inducible protein OsmY
MVQPPSHLILPTGEPKGEQMNADGAAATPLTQRVVDLDLAARVGRALRATGYAPLRGVEVTVHELRVILRGHVPNYHLKQVAQGTALAVLGAQEVRNDLEVDRPS